MTYLLRVFLVVLVLLVVAANHHAFRFGGGAPGLRVFRLVTTLNLVFIAVVGLNYFSSAITEEKEDGTLGLLRMTNLNSLSILLGKSTSRLIGFLLLLLTQLPFVTLAVTLGGVSLRQILICYGVLGAFTFLLANVCLFFSVICRRTALAVVCTLFSFVACFGGFWLVGLLLDAWFGNDFGFGTLADFMSLADPRISLVSLFGVGFNELPLAQMISNLAAGAVFFLLSWAVFDVFNQGEGRGATPSAARKKRGQLSGNAAPLASVRPLPIPRPADWPVTWLEFYFRCGGMRKLWLSLFFLLGLTGFLLFVRYTVSPDPPRHEEIGAALLTIGLIEAGVRWALEMSTVFHHERKNQTWSSLALLPKSIQRLAYEKLLASFVFILPGLLVAAFGFFLLADDVFRIPKEIIFYGLLYAFTWFLFASHLIAWLSLYLRWGSLPLALVACFVLQMVLGLVSALRGYGSMEEVVIPWGFGLVVASVFLHRMIGQRLADLATED